MKCTGEPVKSFSVHDFFLKQDEADVYWHVYSLLALREKSWTEKLFTGSPVHFTVPISPVDCCNKLFLHNFDKLELLQFVKKIVF